MPKHKRLPSELTDREWEALHSLLPQRTTARGRPRADNRQTLNGILFVLSTGCRWGDVPPERYGPGKTCYHRFREWEKNGVWNAVAGVLLMRLNQKRKLNLTNMYLDASIRQNKRGLTIRLATPASRRKTA